MRTLKIWREENCFLKHTVYRSFKALQLNMFHLLGSTQCLRIGKAFWSIATAQTTMTLPLQTGEKNVSSVITGDHILKTGGLVQIWMDLFKL